MVEDLKLSAWFPERENWNNFWRDFQECVNSWTERRRRDFERYFKSMNLLAFFEFWISKTWKVFQAAPDMISLAMSARKNLCINEDVYPLRLGSAVDGACQSKTARYGGLLIGSSGPLLGSIIDYRFWLVHWVHGSWFGIEADRRIRSYSTSLILYLKKGFWRNSNFQLRPRPTSRGFRIRAHALRLLREDALEWSVQAAERSLEPGGFWCGFVIIDRLLIVVNY